MATRAQTSDVVATRRPATRRSPDWLRDTALAGAAFAISLALYSHRAGALQPERGQFKWVTTALLAVSTLPLARYRRAPLAVFVITSSAAVLLAALGNSIGLPIGALVALYLLAGNRNDAMSTNTITATALAALVAYLVACAIGGDGFPGSALFHTSLAGAVAWFAGERTRLRREQLDELRERAARADREREHDRRLALAEERARIARDLHDSVGHAINVIAVRAGAARLRHHEDPDRSRVALEAIEEIARQTAAEVDTIVGTLRNADGANDEHAPSPIGLASLSTLVAHHREAGVDIDVVRCGAARPLGRAVDLAAFRILQEALTNAARHGRGPVHVELHFGDEQLVITVTNRLPETGASSAVTRGHGLIGMSERAAMLGGTFDAGVDTGAGSFRVRARLPYEARRP